ncbi:hypothetical protein O181_037524 [Austropuccinia psidii MF-1]|uniref:HAT C-terminal dimerisation domain-containing protein n=1 Tax=Austropuccinia psidii MF-1 TaxID=1389203 RepID=A0A9Q3D6J5_9BASI|nr:hypothetical protein [Austropuccinia psidii MF-1]
MTRWNYFLKQVQRAQLLKNSIQLYTQTPHGSAYVLNDEVWASMEFMEPILQMFEGACNLFQREGPTKHLVLPIYNSLIKKLHHYACDSPPAWSQACHAAIDKIHKYKDHEMKNNDTLMATLLNPSYRQGMFKLIGLSPQRSQEVMDALSQEYLILTADSSPIGEDLRVSTSPCPNKDSPQRKLLKMYDCALQLTSSNPTQTGNMDEVFSYLQNQHPIMEGEDILKYWKVSFWCSCGFD